MILNALVEKLKRRSKDDFKGRHFEAMLILQVVSWYLRYPLSYRDIEELFLERGLEVDHATLNRRVLAYAPLIERRLRTFRKPHCGSIRVDETYIKVRGQWRYLYRAVDKHGNPVDFLLTAKRDLEGELASRVSAANIDLARKGLADPDPMVRIGALDMLESAPASQIWPVISPLLADANR